MRLKGENGKVMELHLFNKIEETENLVDYIKDTIAYSDTEIRAVIEKIARERIPLERADIDLSREIESIVEDYCDDYCVDIDSVWDALNIEELIYKL